MKTTQTIKPLGAVAACVIVALVAALAGFGKGSKGGSATGKTPFAYCGDIFVAMGGRGNDATGIAYSSDGVTWTDVKDVIFPHPALKSETFHVTQIAHGIDKFVAVGYDHNHEGKIAYSMDGTRWIPIDFGAAFDYSDGSKTKKASITAVAYLNGKFVASGEGGKRAYSRDGLTWTAQSDSTLGTFVISASAYVNSKLAAWALSAKVSDAGIPSELVEFNGKEEPLKLRNTNDLYKLDTQLWGLSGADLSALDLTKEESRLREMPFDTLTKWPERKKMPGGFDPQEILDSGKNPSLGLRAIHAKGIDGRGVDIAMIDQPLVPDHIETENNLKIIAELDVQGVKPQMHGPLVTSLAAGKNCGVAPKANLYYVSMPMWEDTNRYYIQALETILDLNKNKMAKIRAVGVSTGMFKHYAQFDKWQTLLERAESEGVLVITCDLEATKLQYALLRPLPNGDREKPEGYAAGTYASQGDLLVPRDNCTYASHLGKNVYSYQPTSGMSMGPPWLVGLAALGFQVNPKLKPAEIRKYLMESATIMPYGKVVNPKGFLEMCRAKSPIYSQFT